MPEEFCAITAPDLSEIIAECLVKTFCDFFKTVSTESFLVASDSVSIDILKWRGNTFKINSVELQYKGILYRWQKKTAHGMRMAEMFARAIPNLKTNSNP